jgi:hypothetical protein
MLDLLAEDRRQAESERQLFADRDKYAKPPIVRQTTPKDLLDLIGGEPQSAGNWFNAIAPTVFDRDGNFNLSKIFKRSKHEK